MISVREKNIQSLVTSLAEIRQANGYNTECGINVQRARPTFDPDKGELPAIDVWPQPDEVSREYGKNVLVMPIRIEALMLFEDDNPSVISEMILADIIEHVTGIQWSLPFKSGGSYEVKVGDIIVGNDSDATAYVTGINITAGAWTTGDAEGVFIIKRVLGEFGSAETLSVGSEVDVCTLNGSISGVDPAERIFDNCIDRIEYSAGGTDEYPGTGERAVGVYTLFNIYYRINIGDPYSQPS